MTFEDRLYRGKHSKYSSVQFDLAKQERLLIITSTWGDPKASTSTIETIRDYYLSAKTDKEYTSPYPLSKELSLSSNHLRIGLMLANERIYKEFNQEEYTAGVEVMAIAIHEREVNVSFIGGPNFLMAKNGQKIIPCIQQQQLAFEFKASAKYPLPKDMLGIHLKKYVSNTSYRINKNDELYFIYADFCPQITGDESLEEVEKKLQLENERPYWLAKWQPFT